MGSLKIVWLRGCRWPFAPSVYARRVLWGILRRKKAAVQWLAEQVCVLQERLRVECEAPKAVRVRCPGGQRDGGRLRHVAPIASVSIQVYIKAWTAFALHLFCGTIGWQDVPPEWVQEIRISRPGGQMHVPANLQVLVFTKTAGYRHASIPDGISMMRDLGQKFGFGVDCTEDADASTWFTEGV